MFGHRHGGHHWGPPGRAIRRKIESTLEELLLEELEKKPLSGLGLIEALGERFRGWLPLGPDSVYPLLQLLEDRGQLSRGEGNVYSLTDAGRARLEESRNRRSESGEEGDLPLGAFGPGCEHGFGAWLHHLDAAKIGKIKDVVHKAMSEIKGIAVS